MSAIKDDSMKIFHSLVLKKKKSNKPEAIDLRDGILFGKETITFNNIDGYNVYGYCADENRIIPPFRQPRKFMGDTLLWIMPSDALSQKHSYMIRCSNYTLCRYRKVTIIYTGEYTMTEYACRPLCDIHGKTFSIDCPQASLLLHAYSVFYWDNILPEVAELTFMRHKKEIQNGYVLSTLDTNVYGGTYPAVDHEFHIKGRYAIGGKAEKDLIGRMLKLQIKIMREDKKGLYRNVCSIQPNGKREYNVWRKSINKKQKAQMFRITANIEFIEELYLYYCMSKDIDFISEHIYDMEMNCKYIESFIDASGLLDSHVYYEDQVIKNGKVAQAQFFAVNSFRLAAKLEELLKRTTQAKKYIEIAERLKDTAVRAYPDGYWLNSKRRFADWIDNSGASHDHVHLLSNELPALFGIADEVQNKCCLESLKKYNHVFNKFPSFVAGRIEDYTPDEIGVGGPYDLAAAGRYWCWDSEFKAFMSDDKSILNAICLVANEVKSTPYMGERYDMNYMYYNEGAAASKKWHGAAKYYEYPNTYEYVLICLYCGIKRGFDCDIILNPLIEGKVYAENYGISFTNNKDLISLQNITSDDITIHLTKFDKRILLKGNTSVVFDKNTRQIKH